MITIKSEKIKRTLFLCLDNDGQLQYDKGGRIVCGHCYSIAGIKSRNYRVNGVPRISGTCISCRANEKRNNSTGEILSQTVDMMLVGKNKSSFLANYPQK